jgi:hypothetical protein
MLWVNVSGNYCFTKLSFFRYHLGVRVDDGELRQLCILNTERKGEFCYTNAWGRCMCFHFLGCIMYSVGNVFSIIRNQILLTTWKK